MRIRTRAEAVLEIDFVASERVAPSIGSTALFTCASACKATIATQFDRASCDSGFVVSREDESRVDPAVRVFDALLIGHRSRLCILQQMSAGKAWLVGNERQTLFKQPTVNPCGVRRFGREADESCNT